MVDLLRYLTDRGVLSEADGLWRVVGELPDLSRELPESVRGMVQRKLDRLDAADRQLLAAAAVQGYEFEMLVVADALARDAADVEQRLHHLDRLHGLVRMLRAHELPDRSLSIRYAFVHALYQQALYHELLPTRQASLSLALAQAIERRYSGSASAVAAELACLYEVGRDWLAAARQLWLASLNAARVFAHGEAVTLARRALMLLESLPASPKRTALEIDVQTTLGLQLQVTRGYATPAAKQAYLAARRLCLQCSQEPTFPVLWGLWLYHKVRSELDKARSLAEELSASAQRLNAPDLALQAYQARAMTAFCRGEQHEALRHVEQAAALYDPAQHETHAFQFGQDPGVICKAFGAVVLWLLGYPDAAATQSDAALRMSEDLSPSSRAVAYHFAAMVHQLRRDPPRVRQAAEACDSIAAEHGLSFWLAGSAIFRGWALAASGETGGVEIMRRGISDWQATGSVTYRTYYLGILAETLHQHGEQQEAIKLLEESIQLADETGEGLYAAELHRLRGEIFRAIGGLDKAQSDFARALSLARQRDVRSLELRATASLAQLYKGQGRGKEAELLLAPMYEWFTEGHTSHDLITTKSLLEAVKL
jgi:predicted ATPase